MTSKRVFSEIGLVLAETTRSDVYLEFLVNEGFLPAFVLVMSNKANNALPGQVVTDPLDGSVQPQFEIAPQSFRKNSSLLERKLLKNNIEYEISPSHDINAEVNIKILKRRPEFVFVYSGYGGVFLRAPILAIGKKFLHIHGGYLPDYKGSTCNYFSILTDGKIGASSIFLTDQLDSGNVIVRRLFDPPKDKRNMDHLDDSICRAKVLIESLKKYLADSYCWNFELEDNSNGEVYYIIHPLLKHIAILN